MNRSAFPAASASVQTATNVRFPPLERRLSIDAHTRGTLPYEVT